MGYKCKRNAGKNRHRRKNPHTNQAEANPSLRKNPRDAVPMHSFPRPTSPLSMTQNANPTSKPKRLPKCIIENPEHQRRASHAPLIPSSIQPHPRPHPPTPPSTPSPHTPLLPHPQPPTPPPNACARTPRPRRAAGNGNLRAAGARRSRGAARVGARLLCSLHCSRRLREEKEDEDGPSRRTPAAAAARGDSGRARDP